MNYYKYILSAFLLFIFSLNLYAAYSVSEEWSTYVGGQYGNDVVNAAAMDANGMVYFGGSGYDGSVSNDDGVNATEYTYHSGGNNSFVAASDSFGVLQWYSVLGNDGYDEIRGIAEDGSSVFSAGVQERADTYDDGTDAYLYSLSNTNGSLNWSYDIGEPHATNAFNAVTVDTNGNIYAVGYTSITQIESTPNVPGYHLTPGGTTFGQSLQGDLDAFVAKFSPSGSLLWVHYLGGENYDSALACTIGTNGYLYVGGETCSTGWVSNTSSTFPSTSSKAGFVVKLSTAGDHIWSTYLGGTYNDSVTSLAFENCSGNLFAAGTTFSNDYMANENRLNSPSVGSGDSDGFVTSITDNGGTRTVNWSKFYGSAQDETITSIRQLDDSELVIGGTTPNGSWLASADNAHSGASDGYLVILQPDGTDLWSTYTGGSDTESLNAIAARNGIFYAGGMTRSDGWVTNGFHTTWDKDDLWGDGSAVEFGFLYKYQSSGYAPDPPEITSQPQPVTVEEQQDAHFSIASVGTQPITYQWRVNGAPVADATNTSFTLSSVQLAQDGDLISCALSNAAAVEISDNALLTVTAIPNGYITIDISPTGAVSNGAAWSSDSGSTWHDDGEVINVVTGVYPIVYKNDIFGWAAPTSTVSTTVLNGQTNSLVAVYTQIFYTNYREISGTNVTVVVDPPANAEQVSVIETLPEGLTPYDYTPLQWVESSRQLRYITYDTSPAQFTYSVRGADGEYNLSGTVNFGSGTVTTVGDNRIVIGDPPPVVPEPDIIGFAPDGGVPGNFLLTFISIADQLYLVETNGAPAVAGWAQQGQLSGTENQTTTSVPASGPSLFYRVRTPAP